jgi:nucleotide-binding universal stress UspA family protein
MAPKKVMFCTDFSENSANARELAKEYAAAFNAELIVLHVINVSQLGYPAFQQGVPFDQQAVIKAVEDSVTKALEEVAQDCGQVIENVDTAYLMGNPPTEIVGFAEEQAVELVVIGTHGWTGLKHLVLGSVAENVVRTCPCPVLTVRSPSTD